MVGPTKEGFLFVRKMCSDCAKNNGGFVVFSENFKSPNVDSFPFNFKGPERHFPLRNSLKLGGDTIHYVGV